MPQCLRYITIRSELGFWPYAQAWEHDKQKMHNYLDGIKHILDARMLSLYSNAPPLANPHPMPQPLPTQQITEQIIRDLAQDDAVAQGIQIFQGFDLQQLQEANQAPPPMPEPLPEAPAPQPEAPAKPPSVAEKEPDSKSEPSNVSASSGAGNKVAEKPVKKSKELHTESSEMDVACILNDLAKASADGKPDLLISKTLIYILLEPCKNAEQFFFFSL